MTVQLASWLITILKPPLLLVRLTLDLLSATVFQGIDRRIAQRNESILTQDVKKYLTFLFTEYKGRTVANEGVECRPGFDYAITTVAIDGFRLKFIRGRGELGVLVAPASADNDWHDLSLVVAAVSSEGCLGRQHFTDLTEVSQYLNRYLEALLSVFSSGGFGPIKQKLEDEVYAQEREAISRWETRVNRRLSR